MGDGQKNEGVLGFSGIKQGSIPLERLLKPQELSVLSFSLYMRFQRKIGIGQLVK